MKRKVGLIILSILGLFLGLGKKEFTITRAVADSDIKTIGIYYEAEHVEQRTRVTVTGEDIDIAVEAGRDLVLVSGPIFPPGGPIRPNSYGDTYVSGYYYATPEDGIIVARHEIKNDIASLTTILNILENEIDYFNNSFDHDMTLEDKNNLLLGYIRSFNTSYKSSEDSSSLDPWTVTCGINEHLADFISFINGFNTGGISIREYFASFLSIGKYNTAMGNIDFYNNSLTYLGEEVLNLYHTADNANIDLIHLFASIDAISNNTGANDLSRNTFHFVASWAGDLQSLCASISSWTAEDMANFDIIEDDFEHNQPFSYADLYADIDAINIATNLNLSTLNSIALLLSNYYQSLVQNSRYTNFVYNIDSVYSSNHESPEENFKACVFELVDLKYHGSDLPPGSDDGVGSNESYKFRYLYSTDPAVSFEYRVIVANQFVNYILERF